MKGVSEVIAILLMLIITIALAGLAYAYISGVFTTKTMALSATSSYCSGSPATATWVVRNEGATTIPAASITIASVDETCGTDPTAAAITGGGTTTFTASGCGTGRYQRYRMTGPSNTIDLMVYCP